MQSLGRMREQVPMLVHGASLHRDTVPHGGKRLLQPRCAVNDEELRSAKAALDQVIENRAPGFGAFSAHALGRQQHLLAVRAHADDHKQRD